MTVCCGVGQHSVDALLVILSLSWCYKRGINIPEKEELKMTLINLTPHVVNLVTSDGTVTIPPNGTVARCAVTREVIGQVEIEAYGATIPLTSTRFGAVEGLPEPVPGTLFIVSALVAQAAKRDDLVIPDDAVRDEAGRIIGCRALARI